MVSKRKMKAESADASTSKKACPEIVEEPEVTDKEKKKSKKSKKLVPESPVKQSSESPVAERESPKKSPVKNSKIEETPHTNTSIPNWSEAHMSELLRRMENVLPPKDRIVYKSRVEKLNWEEVAFENYTAAECRLMWEQIQKRLRKFRLLSELIDDAKDWITKPWTTFYGSNKTNRHPDMPRKPLTTYMIFYMKKKDKVLKENPGLDVTGLSKQIAEMYKNLPEKTKEKYNRLAAEQREIYAAKMKEFYENHPELAPQKGQSAVTVSNGNTILKPITPFKLYLEDMISKQKDKPGFDKAAFTEQCKEQWKNLSDKKKVFWINWACDREAKYQEQMKDLMAENPEMQPQPHIKHILTKEERSLQERMAGKPQKPPNSAYSLFSRLMLTSEEVKSVNPKDRMVVISQQWKNLTEADKKQYSDKAKHMLEQYKLQYAEYLESLPEEKRQEELQSNQPKKKKTPTKEAKALQKKIEDVKLITEKSTAAAKKKKTKPSAKKTTTKGGVTKFKGEPEQPPASPFLLFAKNFQEGLHGTLKEAEDVWDAMNEDQQSHYKELLWNMKKTYIENYETFLKGLTQEELKQYSEWKKRTQQADDTSDESSDEADSNDDDSSNE